MRVYREWAADFLAAAATVKQQERKIVNRQKIVWRDLPTAKEGRTAKLSPIHGNVYQAFLHNVTMQDMEADSVESDASNSQIAAYCYWSMSQVEEAIRDLEAVGLINRVRRMNRSSVTTVFRTAGNFGPVKPKKKDTKVAAGEGPSADPDTEDIDLPAALKGEPLPVAASADQEVIDYAALSVTLADEVKLLDLDPQGVVTAELLDKMLREAVDKAFYGVAGVRRI